MDFPTPLTPALAIGIWAKATKCEMGLIVETSDRRATQTLLYKVRKESPNPEFDKFAICMVGDSETELFLVRKAVELGE